MSLQSRARGLALSVPLDSVSAKSEFSWLFSQQQDRKSDVAHLSCLGVEQVEMRLMDHRDTFKKLENWIRREDGRSGNTRPKD